MTFVHVLAVLGFFSLGSSFILDPTTKPFIFAWRDCGDKATEAVTLTNLDISPKPAVVPGNLTVTVEGEVKRSISNDTRMSVTIKKEILGRWTLVPCKQNVGSCIYDNPCEFLQAFEGDGNTCPSALADHGLPCTCPFSPKSLSVPPSVVSVTSLPSAWSFVASGNYFLHAEMTRGPSHDLIGCFEVNITLAV